MDHPTDEEKRIFPNIMSVEELMAMDFSDEPDEVPYRRGYRDGFIEAVMYLQERPRGIGYDQLLDILFSHWEVPLSEWQRRGESGAYEQPPQVKIPGNVYRRPFGELQRRAIIVAHKFTCFYCNRESRSYRAGPGGKPWHIDHHTPLARGGTNEPENLVLACASCNTRKHTNRW